MGLARTLAALLLMCLSLVASCASPRMQDAQRPPEGFTGPYFDVAGERFYSFDGAPLGLSTWMPPRVEGGEAVEPWAVVVALHGINDAADTYSQAARWLSNQGIAVYAFDARGFGRSPNRFVWPADDCIIRDTRTAIALARRAHPNAKIVVLGGSMGAAEAIMALTGEGAPEVDRVILLAPGVWRWEDMPALYSGGLRFLAHVLPNWMVVPSKQTQRNVLVSDNPDVYTHIENNPHRNQRTRIDTLYLFFDLMDRASDRISQVRANMIFMYGAHDALIPPRAAADAAARMPANARSVYYLNGYHTLLRDCQAETVYRDILAYIRDADAPLPSGAPPMPSVQEIATNTGNAVMPRQPVRGRRCLPPA